MNNINKTKRAELIKGMNDVILSLNDECLIDRWLMMGVADGDTTLEDMQDYTDDETFSNLMWLFAIIMKEATEDGAKAALYCDGIAGGRGR